MDTRDAPTTNRNPLSISGWNPYYAGAGIGLLSILVFIFVDKPLGMSTEVSKFSGWLASIFVGWDSVANNPYWASKTPAFGYSTVFLIATVVGAFISSKLDGTFHVEKVPRVWREHYGNSTPKRMFAAFAVVAVVIFTLLERSNSKA